MNTSPTVFPRTRSKNLHIALWVVQGLLAVLFLMSGIMKLVVKMPGMEPGMLYFIGTAEILGGLGVVLPTLLRIKPILTPIAAGGLLTIMILATGFHIMKAEYSHIGGTVVFGLMAAFVIWGRTKKEIIQPK